MKTPVYNIVIVDDHQLFSTALCELIAKIGGYKVLYTVKNGQELKEMFRAAGRVPDLVLLDIVMPVMDGFETATWLKKDFPDVGILALSMNNDEESVLKMIRLGAKGYILKDTSDHELKTALDTIKEKGFYHSELVSRSMLSAVASKEKEQERIQLSDREKEFLKLACSDLTYKEIADKMCLSPRTIDGYREALFEKFDVKSRVGLVLQAIQQKLIP